MESGVAKQTYPGQDSGQGSGALLSTLRSLTSAGSKQLLLGMGLASLSGFLWFLACPNLDLWPLAWVAMLPVLFAMERASSSRRAVFFAGWASLIGNSAGFYWIVGLLERFARVPRVIAILLLLLLGSYQASRFLLFALAVRFIRRKLSMPMSLVAPVVMVAVELCVPFIFSYNLAITQARQGHVIQIAELTGPLGVTALLMMINGAIFDVLVEGRRRLTSAAISFAILAAALGYGHLRINQIAEQRAQAPKIKVGIVQPNVGFGEKGLGTTNVANEYLTGLQLRSAELEAAGADLIVWPETIYPSYIPRQAGSDWPQHPLRIRRGFETPLIFGALTRDVTAHDRRLYNSALVLDHHGRLTGRYDKNYLLMFGEYMPGLERFPWIRRFLPRDAEEYAWGNEIVTFPLQTRDGRTWRLGPMICLEDTLPAFGRRLAQLHPHVMINLTEDSWYGDTSEPWQHLALSIYRSIELRTELVRAVNPGVSAYVDAAGRVYMQTYSVDPAKNRRGPDKVLAEVALIEGGHTVYAAMGDLFGYLNVTATIVSLFLPRLLRVPMSRAANQGDHSFSAC